MRQLQSKEVFVSRKFLSAYVKFSSANPDNISRRNVENFIYTTLNSSFLLPVIKIPVPLFNNNPILSPSILSNEQQQTVVPIFTSKNEYLLNKDVLGNSTLYIYSFQEILDMIIEMRFVEELEDATIVIDPFGKDMLFPDNILDTFIDVYKSAKEQENNKTQHI